MGGQPQQAGFWVFDVVSVEAVEEGVLGPVGAAPSMIVNAGNNFDLRVTISLEGFAADAGTAPWYDPAGPTEGARIEHFALNTLTGVVTPLPYRIPSGQPSLIIGHEYQVNTGPYSTGVGADLDVGMYEVTTCIRLTTPDLDHTEAGFSTSHLWVIA